VWAWRGARVGRRVMFVMGLRASLATPGRCNRNSPLQTALVLIRLVLRSRALEDAGRSDLIACARCVMSTFEMQAW